MVVEAVAAALAKAEAKAAKKAAKDAAKAEAKVAKSAVSKFGARCSLMLKQAVAHPAFVCHE
jgi:hypothetical protein